MEKKYLELINNGMLVGAFEDVTVFEERNNGNEIYLESADGNYTLTKQNGRFVFNGLTFTGYNYCCRRTLRNHTNNLESKRVAKVNLREN